jgi:cell division septal protein FtsQ
MQGEIYLDEKQRKRRRRILRLKIYAGVMAFFVLLIGIGYLIVYSPLFQIKTINAEKGELTEQLKSYFAGKSLFANILGSDNILIWTNKTESFLKERHQIAELTIKKDYFNRQIDVNYKEREKFGIWCLQAQNYAEQTQNNAENFPRESACLWFDKDGVLFAEAPLMEGELINKVFDSSGRELKIGDKILEENLLENLLKIFEVLQKSELSMKNLYLQDLSLQEVAAQSPNLPKIYFSLRFSPESALPAIQSLKNSGLGKLDYIDFRVENRAYYKLK